jgi:hypothetical protein
MAKVHWALAGTLLVAAAGCATPQPANAPAPVRVEVRAGGIDYNDPAVWLCLPGRDDACASDQSTTVIRADGTLAREEWRPNPNAPIDCFYVYPTVSQEPARLSGVVPTAAERNVATSQAARFGSQCRVFAPMYRQVTLMGLRAALAGGGDFQEAFATSYQDVLDAWNAYLARDNGGRGVVLIGHSQGSIMLNRLIREEIDGRPIQGRIVSAMLLGWNTMVPEGRDVGGDFRTMPLCRSATQTGCVISYVSFHRNAPPPPDALFGRSPVPGARVACTNPAALAGGRAELDSYLSSARAGLPAWVTPERPIPTPFVRAPGLVFGECVADGNASYLSISVSPEPGALSPVLGGEVRNTDGSANAQWGLHLLDVGLGMGNLVALVGSQAQAYRSRR